jgi:signal transduction histidine kinase
VFRILFIALICWCHWVHAMPDSEFNALRQTLFKIEQQDYQRAIKHVDDLLLRYQHELTLEQQIRLSYSKAFYLHKSNLTVKALDVLYDAKDQSLTSKDPAILYGYYTTLCGIFREEGLLQASIEHCKQARKKAEFFSDRLYSLQAGNNLALLLIKTQQYPEAKIYLEQFYQYGLQEKEYSIQAIALNNLGELALSMGDVPLAERLHQQALALRNEHQLTIYIPWSLINLAKVAKAKQDWPTTASLAKRALAMRQDINESEQIEPGLMLVEALQQLGQFDEAQQQLTQSLAIANRLQQFELLMQAWQLQANYFRHTKQYELAMQALNQQLTAQKKLADERFNLNIAQSVADLKLKSKEAEMQELNRQHQLARIAEEAEQHRLWLLLATTLVFLILTLGFSLYIRRQSLALTANLAHLQRTKSQLVEAEKMAALTSLVTGMAHQLNTPLGIVLTAVTGGMDGLHRLERKLAEKTLTSNDLKQGFTESREMLQLAEQNTTRAAELVERFKLISSQFEMRPPEPIAIESYLRQNMQVLISKFQPEKAVKLNCMGAALTIMSYPLEINKILSALTENALKHGLVAQPDPHIDIEWYVSDQQLKIIFSDNGCGIPDENVHRVFDPFFSTSLGQGSLGLGLNIVFNTLHRLNGSIELLAPARNEPGTRFCITLPLR